MPQARKNWGFPRWGEYGHEREAAKVRLCDYFGCERPGAHPAPKSPYTGEKWWFCEEHAAEYNKNWNFFEGMRDEEARAYARRERAESAGFAKAGYSAWGGATDEAGLSRIERAALAALGVEPNAGLAEIKRKYRALAKRHHPDLNPDDPAASKKFQELAFAYEVLKGRFAVKG
ncbi:MAG TPA: J domain-containing protein [Sphingomonadales bacterium]|nr:J domain-containing protein [Sphingomonadales bacterium]